MRDCLSALADGLTRQGQTVTCAESCTGGLLASELTRLPGSSAYFEAGFVTYSNEAKQRMLGVPADILAQYGAVSPETARQMAEGARQAAGADWAAAVSGIAGPSGGSAAKPVGTVCFGFAGAGGSAACTRHFSGSRDDIRRQAVRFALETLSAAVLKQSLPVL